MSHGDEFMLRHTFGALHNIGLSERLLRMAVATILVGGALLDLDYDALDALVILPIIAVYPFITAILGWDPLYALFERVPQNRASSTH
jgi:hypothetical protein